MNVKHLGSGIVLIENLLDKEALDSIDLNLIESQCTPQGYKKIDGKDYMEGGYHIPEEDLCTMPIRYMQDIDTLPFYKTIDDAIYQGAVQYCMLFPVAAESITNCVGKHFIKYLPGGLMGPHSDSSLAYKDGTIEPVSAIALGNTVTVSVILNEEFEGGSIQFKTWGIEVSPKPGSALFYPSNYIGAHNVREITSGKRWAFLAFLSHGDRSFTPHPELEKYADRYEWTMKLRQDVRDKLHTNEYNLNICQKQII
jgi:hypothetical protein